MVDKNRKSQSSSGQLEGFKETSGASNSFSLQNKIKEALHLHNTGRFNEAEGHYKEILQKSPNEPDVLYFLGFLNHQKGNNDTAIELINKSLSIKQDNLKALNNLGIILKSQGRTDEAIACYRRVLSLEPNSAKTLCNLGSALQDKGKLDEAVDKFKKAITLEPDFANAHYNLGNALQLQGKFNEALVSFKQALIIKPDFAEVYNNLGNVLKDKGKMADAVACYRQSIMLQPDNASVHNNLGNALKNQGKPLEAVSSFQNAINLKPDFAEAYNNLANTLKDQGKLDEAITIYRQALKLKPDFMQAYSNLLMYLTYLPKQSVSFYLEEARHYGKKVKGMVSKRFSEWSCSFKPDRLCIGLVSGDFRNHPVGYFLENMLINMDQAKIDFIAYHTHHIIDELTARIHPRFAAWRSLVGMNDEKSAHLIHDDKVNILLDLSGHTSHNRLPVFAWKAAPVQTTWLGYFASTGITEMDFIIADPITVPEPHQSQFIEKVWYLPDTRFCFSPPVTAEELPLSPLPAMDKGYVTFGSYQNLAKINEEVLAVWSRILQELPKSKLRLQNRFFNSESMCEQMQERLAQHGISPDRVILAKFSPRNEYLASYSEIDIILDTYPFNGGTTTCEALWMGVPTLTLAGNTMISRQGASLLTCAGLTDWIAKDDKEYIAKTIAFTSDLDKLAKFRAGLRQQVILSPLFDGPRFARNFESAMWKMWNKFQT